MRRSPRFYLSVLSTLMAISPLLFFSLFVSCSRGYYPSKIGSRSVPSPPSLSFSLFVSHNTFSTGSPFCLFLPFREVDVPPQDLATPSSHVVHRVSGGVASHRELGRMTSETKVDDFVICLPNQAPDLCCGHPTSGSKIYLRLPRWCG